MSRLAPGDATLPSPPPRPRVRAGGRSEDVRRRVAQACLDLLAAGEAELGPVEVARRAGVSRATLHRWWPTKADLLREALTLHTRSLAVAVDTGTWAGDVRALAQRLAVFFAEPVEVAQNGLMASGSHPDYTAAVLAHYEPLFDGWRAMVARARDRGELADGVDVDAVLLTLASPLVVVPLLFRRPLRSDEVDGIVALVLRATRP
jgi:AcrR family transcriptional regulator